MSSLAILRSVIDSRWSVGGLLVVTLALGAGTAAADPNDDLYNRKSDWDKIKGRTAEASRNVDSYLEESRKLRAMDKSELDALIAQICRLDIARNDDEADRLAKSITDNVVKNVKSEYDNIDSEANRLEGDVQRLMNDAKSLRDYTKTLTSYPEIKDDTEKLLSEMSVAIDDLTLRIYTRLNTDYRTLDNLKEGTMNGSNNPKIRAAMEYGKQKHIELQKICQEKELTLSSGRPDCVTFDKEGCAVWEFKPSTYSESEAKSQAERYLRDVEEMFKADPRALENCKKDSSGRPIFEAKGLLYPACGSF